MKFGKKSLAMVLSFAMLIPVFGGCTSQQANSGNGKEKTNSTTVSTQKAGKNVNIEFWTISLQPTFTDFFNGVIKDYEKEHSNVKVKWVDLPYDAIQSKLITSAAGGTSPDVVNLNTQFALQLASKKALVDLNKEATPEQKGIYIESLYNSAKLGDSVYAFPWYASPSVLLYNKELFKKAGIKEVPKTVDEALNLAKTMKDKTGAYMYYPEEFARMLFLNGIHILNEDKTKAAFNNQETLDLINKYKKLADSGFVPKQNWGKWDEELKMFETNKLAVINSSGSSINRIKDEAPNVYKNLAVAAPLIDKGGFVLDPLMNVVVPTASKNHKEAIDFAAFVTNDANQLAFCKKVAIFPSTKKASQDSYFTSDTKTLDGQARKVCAEELDKSLDFSLGVEKQDDIQTQINKIYEATILGNTQPKKAIEQYAGSVDKLLASNK